MKIIKGINVTKNTIIPLANNLYRKDERIATKVWPAVRLANNRRPNETDLAKYDTNSISTKRGTKAKGVPAGTKNEKNFNWCFTMAIILTPKKIVIDKPRHKITELVIAKLQATFEIRFDIKTNTNNEQMKGKKISLFSPI